MVIKFMVIKRLLFLFFSFLVLLFAPNESICTRPFLKYGFKLFFAENKKTVFVCIGIAGLYLANKWFRIPGTFSPTVENLNTTTTTIQQAVNNEPDSSCQTIRSVIQQINNKGVPEMAKIKVCNKCDDTTQLILDLQKGIKKVDSDVITIISRGWASNKQGSRPSKGGGLHAAYVYIRDNIICTPCISFDYPEDRRLFNFAQNFDTCCLETVYNEVIKQNPKARIILVGDCIGGLRALRFVAEKNPTQVETLVLESPFTSFTSLTDRIAQVYLKPYLVRFGAPLLRRFFTWYFPNYQASKDNFMEQASNIEGKNIFIGHRKNDTHVSDESMKKLADMLGEKNNVYFYITDNKTYNHSRIMPLKKVQQTVNAFYKGLHYPHNQQLADEGESLLETPREALSEK